MKQLIKRILPKSLIDVLAAINGPRTRLENVQPLVDATKGLSGLEVGGPSFTFKYKVPVYPTCGSLEFANFSAHTVWEGDIGTQTTYFNKRSGKQHILEATDLTSFPTDAFDFILSSNCLEHVANPLKALAAWKRVAKNSIILIVPRKDFNFDHNRAVTSFSHILEDFENDTDEDDLTHLEEILELHDLSRDLPAGTHAEFKERSLANFENRCLHHHVFDDALIGEICDHLDMGIVAQIKTKADWIFLLDVRSHSQRGRDLP